MFSCFLLTPGDLILPFSTFAYFLFSYTTSYRLVLTLHPSNFTFSMLHSSRNFFLFFIIFLPFPLKVLVIPLFTHTFCIFSLVSIPYNFIILNYLYIHNKCHSVDVPSFKQNITPPRLQFFLRDFPVFINRKT